MANSGFAAAKTSAANKGAKCETGPTTHRLLTLISTSYHRRAVRNYVKSARKTASRQPLIAGLEAAHHWTSGEQIRPGETGKSCLRSAAGGPTLAPHAKLFDAK
jgi:hypothetical protein